VSERSKTEQKVFDIVENTILSMNIDIVDVEYLKEGSEWVLRIIIDKIGSVTLDDCSEVSMAIDATLDDLNIFKHPYNLEVSSPGFDRPLITDKDFERNMGQLVEVHPLLIKGAKKWFEGKLVSVTDAELTIILDETFIKGVKPRNNGQEKHFSRQEIKMVKKAVRF